LKELIPFVTNAIKLRKIPKFKFRMSTPSKKDMTQPLGIVESWDPSRQCLIFPPPEGPTNAMVSPFESVKVDVFVKRSSPRSKVLHFENFDLSFLNPASFTGSLGELILRWSINYPKQNPLCRGDSSLDVCSLPGKISLAGLATWVKMII